MQASDNLVAHEISKEMSQTITKLGLVLKHVTGGAWNVNVMTYLTKPPPPADEYSYEEDTYAMNDKSTSFLPNAQGSNYENWARVNEFNFRTMVTLNEKVGMFERETTTMIKTSTGVTMEIEMIRVGPTFHLSNGKFIQGMVELVWHELKISYRSV